MGWLPNKILHAICRSLCSRQKREDQRSVAWPSVFPRPLMIFCIPIETIVAIVQELVAFRSL